MFVAHVWWERYTHVETEDWFCIEGLLEQRCQDKECIHTDMCWHRYIYKLKYSQAGSTRPIQPFLCQIADGFGVFQPGGIPEERGLWKKLQEKFKDYLTVQRVGNNFLLLTVDLLPSSVFNAEVIHKIWLLQDIWILNKLEN